MTNYTRRKRRMGKHVKESRGCLEKARKRTKITKKKIVKMQKKKGKKNLGGGESERKGKRGEMEGRKRESEL